MKSVPTGRLTRNGLVALTAALALALLSNVLGGVVGLVLPAIPGPGAEALHVLWLPLAGVALEVAVAALGILALLWLWNGRWEVGPEHASRLWFAAMAFAVAAAGMAVRLGLGLLAGAVNLSGARGLVRTTTYGLDVGIALFTGLFLFWSVTGLRPFLGRTLAFAALVLGVVGVALLQAPLVVSFRLLPSSLGLAGLAAIVGSLALWIALSLLGARKAKTLPARPTPATAA